ncbi:MAG: ComEC/Rec2 family competence protein, partial [Bryobacteraceae bacterium]
PYARALHGLAERDRDLRLEPRVAEFRVELRLLAEAIALWTRLRSRSILAAFVLPLRAAFWAHDLAVVSALMQIGLALPMVLYFHRVSLTAAAANLPVALLLNLSIPVGFAAILTGWSPAATAAGWLLTSAGRVVDWHAALEPQWRIPDPPAWLPAVVVAALAACCFTVRAVRLPRALALTGLAAGAALLIAHPFTPRLATSELEVSAMDVGQGDSMFVATPEGKLLLVDGGGAGGGLDIGEDVVAPYLWSRSIQRLDVIAATHAHQDHIGGLAALLENFRPAELWTGAFGESRAWDSLRAEASRLGVRIVELRHGRRLALGGIGIDVLAPLESYTPARVARNNDSLVLRLRHGRHSFLLTGDIDRQVEGELLANGMLDRADVLKVAHHGSRTSTGDAFLDRVRPSFAIISSGAGNPYGLPHREVLRRLEDRKSIVLRTDRHGLVSVLSDGKRLRVEMFRQ